MKQRTFDIKCYELAEHFLHDHPEFDTEPNRKIIAYALQSCVEGSSCCRGNPDRLFSIEDLNRLLSERGEAQ